MPQQASKHKDSPCPAVDPDRFLEGVDAAIIGLETGAVDAAIARLERITLGAVPDELEHPGGKICMMLGFMRGYGPGGSPAERMAAGMRMLALHHLLVDALKSKSTPEGLFLPGAGDAVLVSQDLFRAASCAPLTLDGDFEMEALFEMVRLFADPDQGPEPDQE